ncbi:CGNR zinc finger domain-containing protein [Actinophytocola sp.]|uniref:CGNR zinc finger domain-containing protein n=1 Tax=Actinophytocola sp. TaxID=1872138 RepID=UPI002ED5B50D
MTLDEERERRLRFDTGAAWLDLVASVGFAHGPRPTERMYDLDRLREWLATENLLPTAELTETDLDLARDLRQTLRELAEAVVATTETKHTDDRIVPRKADGRTTSSTTNRTDDRIVLPKGITARLNEVLAAEVPLTVRINRSGVLTTSRPATVREALARVARQAVEHLTGPVAATVRACADHDCTTMFIDPGGRRRWCSAETCGVRNRVRAHRERQRAT